MREGLFQITIPSLLQRFRMKLYMLWRHLPDIRFQPLISSARSFTGHGTPGLFFHPVNQAPALSLTVDINAHRSIAYPT